MSLEKFRDEIHAMLSPRNQKKIPPLPEKGNLVLEKVLEKEEKTLYLAIYNSKNQRSYITVKLQ